MWASRENPASQASHGGSPDAQGAERLRVEQVYPHDASAFTQGLVYVDGQLYESTGLHGKSSVRRVDLATGAILQERRLERRYFGEGITAWKSSLIQLSWRSGVGFIYDRRTLDLRRTFRYTGEGWGLTNDGYSLIMSDGTPYLRYLDPATFLERGRLAVTDDGMPVTKLNDLQYAHGELFAHVWKDPRIARISPVSGRVVEWLDLPSLNDGLVRAPRRECVLNGIAYNEVTGRFFVTGKMWPKLFELAIPTGAR
jgi:glutaminyl-peptide cyclotransferase